MNQNDFNKTCTNLDSLVTHLEWDALMLGLIEVARANEDEEPLRLLLAVYNVVERGDEPEPSEEDWLNLCDFLDAAVELLGWKSIFNIFSEVARGRDDGMDIDKAFQVIYGLV